MTVRLFAGHRERVGASSVPLELDSPATVQDAYAELLRLHPALEGTQSFTTFAVNRTVVDTNQSLADGDEVALLQPVSGGLL